MIMNTKLSISAYITKQATKIMKLHTFARENSILIILTIVLRLVTIIISIFSGYNYFVTIFLNLVELPEIYIISISVIFVLIIEILAAVFLVKMFKFFLKTQIIPGIGYGLGVLLFFAVSFHVSTNGLASYTVKKLDNTETIKSKWLYQKDLLYSDFNNYEAETKQAIDLIQNNPTLWKNGKLSGLSTEQQVEINNYYNNLKLQREKLQKDVKEIENSEAKELNVNANYLNTESSKYYKIAAFIMFLSLLTNGLLSFFYHRIYNQSNKELVIKETINSFSTNIARDTDTIIKHQISSQYQMYLTALNHALANQNNLIIPETVAPILSEKSEAQSETQSETSEAKSEPEPTHNPAKKTGKPIGFVFEKSSNNAPVYNAPVVNNDLNIDNEFIICKNCKKQVTKLTWNHTFCSDDCRIEYWEKKNGKKVIKGKSKKQ